MLFKKHKSQSVFIGLLFSSNCIRYIFVFTENGIKVIFKQKDCIFKFLVSKNVGSSLSHKKIVTTKLLGSLGI